MCYHTGILKSRSPKIKTLILGNLSLGGTGKTPHTSFLIDLLADKKVAVISRGYGRKTKGTLVVTPSSNVIDVGDEPLQLAQAYPKVAVVVDANRLRGLSFIRKTLSNTDVVIFDDALQHRKLKGGLNILLTTYSRPFFKESYLPAGDLRDHKCRAHDADVIIVTKCPRNIGVDDMTYFEGHLRPYNTSIFFDRMTYLEVVPLKSNCTLSVGHYVNILLVSAIANAAPFEREAKANFNVTEHFAYRDHHRFSLQDIDRFRNFINKFAIGSTAVLTTEKDAMRLRDILLYTDHEDLPVYFWKIGIEMDDGRANFESLIRSYINEH